MSKNLHIAVSGSFNPVAFNFYCMWMAAKCDINANFEKFFMDTIFFEATGDEDNLKKFLAWCQKGPEDAEIKHVVVEIHNEKAGYKRKGIFSGYLKRSRQILEKMHIL